MADNTENTEVTNSVDESQVTQPEFNDVEKRAMDQGWVPKEQYSGTGKWRDAEEFLDRGELFSKIDELSRRNKSLEGTVHEVKRHYKKMAEAEYNRALRDLRAQKKEALDNGDSDRVVELDEKIQSTKVEAARELQQIERPAQMPQLDPVFVVWQNRNQWYSQDRAMKIYADTLGEELVMKGMTNSKDILQEVERQVKKEFSHKFNNPNRERPGSVEGGGKAGGGKSSDSFQLTPEEIQVMNKFVKHGVMTKDEYIKEVKATRGV